MTLRTEAGDSVIGSARERLREPTGSPVARYVSTMRLKISRERSLSWRSGKAASAAALNSLASVCRMMERI